MTSSTKATASVLELLKRTNLILQTLIIKGESMVGHQNIQRALLQKATNLIEPTMTIMKLL